MAWKPDRVLKALLIWTAITLIIVWLPMIRGLMDGESYQWAASLWGFQVGGRGVRGDYWVLVVEGLFGLALLYLGWRGARLPFHWMLLLWLVPHAIDATYNSVTAPEDYRFQGDTLGVNVSLAWVGPVFFGGFALLGIWWVIRNWKKQPERPAWSRANKLLLIIVACLLPVQFLLLSSGQPHGTTDQIGVILTMLQWVLINLGLYPWSSRTQPQ